METHITDQDQEIKKCAFCWQSDDDPTLGLKRAHPRALSWLCTQYCIVLCYDWKVYTCFHNKCRGMLTNGVALHHENTWPHMAAMTLKTIWKLEF
jgi:hypothetical protein